MSGRHRETDRQRRRRVDRYVSIAAGRRALAERPTILEDFTYRGTAAQYLTIEADPAWPPALSRAWDERRQAATTGRCSCGARIDRAPVPGQVVTAVMLHEADCLVGDDRFMEAVGRWVRGTRS